MKKTKFLIPMTLVMLLASCSTPVGEVPSGGEEIKDQANAASTLALVAQETYSGITNDGATIKLASNGFNVAVTANTDGAPLKNFSLTVPGFSAKLGIDEGKNPKVGLTSDGVKLNGKFTTNGSEEKDSTIINYALDTGKFGAYFVDSTCYLDFSHNNFGPEIEKIIGQLFPSDGSETPSFLSAFITALTQQVVSAVSNLKVSIPLNAKDFNIGGISLDASTFNLKNAETAISNFLGTKVNTDESEEQVTFNDLFHVYSYSDGRISLATGFDKDTYEDFYDLLPNRLTGILANTDVKALTAKEAVLTDTNKKISSIGSTINLNARYSYGEKDNEFYTITVGGDIKAEFNYGKNEVEFPASYSEFKTADEIFGGLINIASGLINML